MRKEIIINNIYTNRLGQKYIVEAEEYSKSTEYYYKIRFLETNTVKIAEKRNIKKGNVKDPYGKTIYGVACKGNVSSKFPLLNKIAFKRWYAMIERCYNEKAIEYSSYGGKGISVCERWLCFENFLNDLPYISGYDEKLYIEGLIQLDKDYKNSTVYSPETCIFVSQRKNKMYQPSKQQAFIAVSPDGISYEFNNQSECARTFGLTARTISKVLNGYLKSHKGWNFYYK